jgi:hypothetical protein
MIISTWCSEFVLHQNDHRPHRSLGRLPPRPQGARLVMLQNVDRSWLHRPDRLGGLIPRELGT